jgi:hypothetical protein
MLPSPARAVRACERIHPEVSKELVGDPQFSASVYASALAPQPLAVKEVGSSELHADARTTEPCDCFFVELLCVIAIAEQRARAGLDP